MSRPRPLGTGSSIHTPWVLRLGGSRKGTPQVSLRTNREGWQKCFPSLGGPASTPRLYFRGPHTAPSGTQMCPLQPPACSRPPQKLPGPLPHQRPPCCVLGRWPRSLRDRLWKRHWLGGRRATVCELDPLPASATRVTLGQPLCLPDSAFTYKTGTLHQAALKSVSAGSDTLGARWVMLCR